MTITFPLNLKEISMWPEAKRNFFSYKSDAKKPKTNNPKTATRQACQTALSYYITPGLRCGRAAAIRWMWYRHEAGAKEVSKSQFGEGDHHHPIKDEELKCSHRSVGDSSVLFDRFFVSSALIINFAICILRKMSVWYIHRRYWS